MWQRWTRRITPFPCAEVETRETELEVDPASVGLDKSVVEKVWKSVRALYETRLHPAVSIAWRRRGKLILSGSIGHISGNSPGAEPDAPKKLASPKSLFLLEAAATPLLAVTVMALDEKRVLHIGDAFCEYVPDFAAQGKERVTIRQVLEHTACLSALSVAQDRSPEAALALLEDRSRLHDMLHNASLEGRPGEVFHYRPFEQALLLGELIEVVTGRPWAEVLNERILKPLGLTDLSYGSPPSEPVAEAAATGVTLPWPLANVLPAPDPVQLAARTHTESFLQLRAPVGNAVGNAQTLASFYQWMLDEASDRGPGLLPARALRRAMASERRVSAPPLPLLPLRYGLGLMLGSGLSLFGQKSERAFGHAGFSCVVGYADPEREMSLALLTSGRSAEQQGSKAWLDVLWTVAAHSPRQTVDLPRSSTARFNAASLPRLIEPVDDSPDV